MLMAESTKRSSSKPAKKNKPEKPYDGFPLTAHANGHWCKKRKGTQYYFGPWDDWEGAIEEYNAHWPHILKYGKRPDLGDTSEVSESDKPKATVGEMCDAFLDSKRTRLDCDELKLRTFREYQETTVRIIEFFGRDRTLESLCPADFDKFRSKLSKGPRGKRSPVSLGKYVHLCRMVFKFAEDEDNAMVERRIRFGSNFRQTPKRVLRLDRQSRDKKLFEAEEVRNLLDAASPALRSMILLGVNAGFGNTDLARLPQSAIDLETGWADYPRPKTAVERRVPLWPETVKALRDAIDERPKAKHVADDGLCFLTRTGMPWVRHTDSGAWLDSIGGEFKKLMRSLDINGRRGFYALRHTFETIAGETMDQVGVNSVMGHADQTMGAVYREHISDERLLAVVETVRTWLWPDGDIAQP